MDGLNHSVITGECSGCVAYRGKVARLEAANAALAAALRGRCCTVEIDGEGNVIHEPNCPLSDTGEGRLPPEAREQIEGMLSRMKEIARYQVEEKSQFTKGAAFLVIMNEAQAALDALKGRDDA